MSTSPWQPILHGPRILLRPLSSHDHASLFAAAADPLIWEQHPDRQRHTPDRFQAYFQSAIESKGALAILDKQTGRIIGSSRFTDHDPARSTVEIGYTFLTREFWGRKFNDELKGLMLAHAFRFVNTAYFVVGKDNLRSRKAMEKLGARLLNPEEAGAVRADPRESAIYMIQKAEWERKEGSRPSPVLQAGRLVLRLGEEGDVPAILRYFRRNEERFAPTDPPRPPGLHTEPFWLLRTRKDLEEWQAGQSLRLFLFEARGGEVVGAASFTGFVRGPFQACYLGYSLDQAWEGKGMMTEALQAAIGHVFGVLNFHRIMANHLPENERSARLLRRLGFAKEGLARDYLFINGRWRDHVLNSLTNPGWKAPE